MKKWNAPEVTELNISETANGEHTQCVEGEKYTIDIFGFTVYEGFALTGEKSDTNKDTNQNS